MAVLNTDTLTWTSVSPKGCIPAARGYHTVSALGTQCVLYGGKGKHGVVKDAVSVYDAVSNTWTSPKVEGSPPTPRSNHAAAVLGTLLIIHGGRSSHRADGSMKRLSDMHALQARAGGAGGQPILHWSRVQVDGPTSGTDADTLGRESGAAVPGKPDKSKGSKKKRKAEPAKQAPAKPRGGKEGRAGHQVVARRGSLYVIAGYSGNGVTLQDVHVMRHFPDLVRDSRSPLPAAILRDPLLSKPFSPKAASRAAAAALGPRKAADVAASSSKRRRSLPDQRPLPTETHQHEPAALQSPPERRRHSEGVVPRGRERAPASGRERSPAPAASRVPNPSPSPEAQTSAVAGAATLRDGGNARGAAVSAVADAACASASRPCPALTPAAAATSAGGATGMRAGISVNFPVRQPGPSGVSMNQRPTSTRACATVAAATGAAALRGQADNESSESRVLASIEGEDGEDIPLESLELPDGVDIMQRSRAGNEGARSRPRSNKPIGGEGNLSDQARFLRGSAFGSDQANANRHPSPVTLQPLDRVPEAATLRKRKPQNCPAVASGTRGNERESEGWQVVGNMTEGGAPAETHLGSTRHGMAAVGERGCHPEKDVLLEKQRNFSYTAERCQKQAPLGVSPMVEVMGSDYLHAGGNGSERDADVRRRLTLGAEDLRQASHPSSDGGRGFSFGIGELHREYRWNSGTLYNEANGGEANVRRTTPATDRHCVQPGFGCPAPWSEDIRHSGSGHDRLQPPSFPHTDPMEWLSERGPWRVGSAATGRGGSLAVGLGATGATGGPADAERGGGEDEGRPGNSRMLGRDLRSCTHAERIRYEATIAELEKRAASLEASLQEKESMQAEMRRLQLELTSAVSSREAEARKRQTEKTEAEAIISNLQKQVTTTDQKAEESGRTAAVAERQLQTLRIEAKQAESQMASGEKAKAELESKVDTLTCQVDAMKGEVQQRREACAEMRGQIEGLESQLSRQRQSAAEAAENAKRAFGNERATLSQALAEQKESAERLQQQLNHATERLRTQQDEIEHLSRQLQQSGDSFDRLQRELERERTERIAVSEELHQCDTAKVTAEKATESARYEIHQLRAANEALESELATARQERMASCQLAERLQGNLRRSEGDVQRMKDIVESLRKQVSEREERCDTMAAAARLMQEHAAKIVSLQEGRHRDGPIPP
eukprot:TRINITY_DN16990_c0_g1_i1.p1 TRINITY_DN16990_c0_g1~~TRINITY_DN16990_c0_g1_i1.p1  ORF type:complete len:1239 (+),score=199.81 TRINITY_DN16990_c0_g1_i1:170-3718(+)